MPLRRAVFLCSVLLSLIAPAAARAALGDLAQLPGTLGCTKNLYTADAKCATGTSLDDVAGVAVSADGENLYTASFFSDAVAIFDGDPGSGSMLQKANPDGCISPDGSGGTCRSGNGMSWDGLEDVAVSPDGKSVYATWVFGVLAFSRNPDTGDLTQLAGTAGCISETDRGGKCTVGKALEGQPVIVAVSPDSKNVYTAIDGKIGTFTRNTTTGQLTFAGCIAHAGADGCTAGKNLENAYTLAPSPDGKAVYTVSPGNGIAILDRDPVTGALTQKGGSGEGCVTETGSSGTCAIGRHLAGAVGELVVSPTNDHLYVVGDRFTIDVFDRNATTNALTQKAGKAGCVTFEGSGNESDCALGRNFGLPRKLVVTPDGRSFYVASEDFSAIAVFDRDPATGAITQKTGAQACVSGDPFWWTSVDRPCLQGRMMRYARDLAVSPDGARLFLGANYEDAVTTFGRDTAGGSTGTGGDTGGGMTDTGTGPPPVEALVAPPPQSLPERPPPPPRPSRFTTVIVSARPGNGTVDVQVGTNGAGRVTVTASAPVNTRVLSGARARLAKIVKLKVAKATKTVTKAGKYKLTLRPTAKAKKILRKKGKLKANLTISFKPANGMPSSTRRQGATFRLKRRR